MNLFYFIFFFDFDINEQADLAGPKSTTETDKQDHHHSTTGCQSSVIDQSWTLI